MFPVVLKNMNYVEGTSAEEVGTEVKLAPAKPDVLSNQKHIKATP